MVELVIVNGMFNFLYLFLVVGVKFRGLRMVVRRIRRIKIGIIFVYKYFFVFSNWVLFEFIIFFFEI